MKREGYTGSMGLLSNIQMERSFGSEMECNTGQMARQSCGGTEDKSGGSRADGTVWEAQPGSKTADAGSISTISRSRRKRPSPASGRSGSAEDSAS